MNAQVISRALILGLALTAGLFAQPGCISDWSFEQSTPGSPPSSAWTVMPGSVATIEGSINPNAFFPSYGNEYLSLSAGSTGPAVARVGPHSMNVAQVRQNFTVPNHEHFAIQLDWEFIQAENQFSGFNDFFTVDILSPSPVGTLLIANLVFIDNGTNAGIPNYNNVPGANGGVLSYVPNQTTFGSAGDWNPAPAGMKRAWADLTGLVAPGQQLWIEITVGNGGDSSVPSVALVDNIRCQVTQRNEPEGALRILGSSHTDGQSTALDHGGDYRDQGTYEIYTMPGQRLCFRPSSFDEGIPWALFYGGLLPTGFYFPGIGTVNLTNPQALIDGVAPGGGDDFIGTLTFNVNYIDMQVASTTPSGTEVAYQALMLTPLAPANIALTAATEVIVDGTSAFGSSAAPRMPLGNLLVSPGNTGGIDFSGGAQSDTGATSIDLGTVGFSSGNWDFYGTSFTEVWVGSNGYLTFGSADADSSESYSEMIGDPRGRIAAVWDDLDPSMNGTVDFTATATTLTVAWEDVPEDASNVNGNWLAVQLYTDGQFTIYYGGTTMTDGLAGIAPGGGMVPSPPAFGSQDWSSVSFSDGNRGAIGSGSARFQQFLQNYAGFISDKFDLMTLGTTGGSRIHFVPDGAGGYTFFTGTR